MSNRGYVIVVWAWSACVAWSALAFGQGESAPRVALITTVWRHNSHADVIAARLLEGYELNGKGEFPRMKLASMYVDQTPKDDKSRGLAARHGVPIFDSIAKALTLGGDRLAVDGVLLVAEHGDYPENETGSTIYPKRRFFTEVIKVFESSGRGVPVFNDKHFADNRADVEWFWSEARRLKVPLMAGSSLPVLWRYPPADVELGKPLKEIVAVSYHRLDAYGFHALEMIQCLVERRQGGETGIRRVRCLEGDEVWRALDRGEIDGKLLDQALGTFHERPWPKGKTPRELVKRPALFLIEYRDGLRASVLTMNDMYVEWASAWRYSDGRTQAASFWTQEARPLMHFTYLVQGIDRMMATGKPSWPADRARLTSSALDALLISRKQGGKVIETPWLELPYRPDGWEWRQPPPPPPGRPLRDP